MIRANIQAEPVDAKVHIEVEGKDGQTPHIGEDGNWYIGEKNTGMPSRGEKGNPGYSPEINVTDVPEGHAISIKDADGITHVVNVKDGLDGKDGKNATIEHRWDGSKLFITSSSGISYADLQGPKGDKGDPGTSKSWLIGSTAEITPNDVLNALSDERNVILSCDTEEFGLISFTYFMVSPDSDFIVTSCPVVLEDDVAVLQLTGIISDNTWSFTISPMSGFGFLNKVDQVAMDVDNLKADVSDLEEDVVNLTEEIAALKGDDIATQSGLVVNVNAEKNSQMKVSANTEEAVTLIHHGKNFIPFSNSGTKTGITYNMNADGSMTISGTATAKTYINLSSKSKTVYLPVGDYVASISGAGLANGAFYVAIEGNYKAGGTFYGFLLDSDGKVTPGTVDMAYDANAYICIESGVTVNSTITLQLETGSNASKIETYKGEELNVESFPVNVTAYGGADVLYTKSGDTISVDYKTSQEIEPELEWSGKKWVCIGDSLTEANARTAMHYHDYIAEKTGITVINMGVSGTGYKNREGADDLGDSFYQRISAVPTDADVVTIFGSGNDLSHTLGTPADTGTDTICGCINTTIDNLIDVMPAVSLGIVAPTPWDNYNPAIADNAMALYVEALKTICENRSIPFLDLYHCSNLRPWTEEGRAACYTKDDGNGVHPDETGHKLIASRFKAFLDALIL